MRDTCGKPGVDIVGVAGSVPVTPTIRTAEIHGFPRLFGFRLTFRRMSACVRTAPASYAAAIRQSPFRLRPGIRKVSRVERLVEDAFNTRIRRSSLSTGAIINLLAVKVESASASLVTSPSITGSALATDSNQACSREGCDDAHEMLKLMGRQRFNFGDR